MSDESLQDRYASSNACFGCGPANPKGLRIKSHVRGDEVVCEWTPEEHHEAYPDMLNGGISGALLDCHLNWTACHHLMVRDGLSTPPCTVTASYQVELKRPTSTAVPLILRARVVESEGRRVRVEGSIESKGEITATCTGSFVAVKEGHPAFHRW